MTTSSGVVVTEVLRRVRDEHGAGHSRTFTLEIVSHAQRIINRLTQSEIATGTLTLQPGKLVYDLTGTFTDMLSPVTVDYRGNNLLKTDLRFLRNVDVSWPRNLSGEPRVFASVGLDLLIIYPVPATVDTATVYYVKDTGLIPGEDQDMSLPDHAIPLVKDLTTAVLLIRQRDFIPAAKLVQKLQQDLGEYRDE